MATGGPAWDRSGYSDWIQMDVLWNVVVIATAYVSTVW